MMHPSNVWLYRSFFTGPFFGVCLDPETFDPEHWDRRERTNSNGVD